MQWIVKYVKDDGLPSSTRHVPAACSSVPADGSRPLPEDPKDMAG